MTTSMNVHEVSKIAYKHHHMGDGETVTKIFLIDSKGEKLCIAVFSDTGKGLEPIEDDNLI